MRRLLQFLTIVAVLFCALHIGEDAYAFEPAGIHAAGEIPGEDDHDGAAAHAIHQHCPVTADLWNGPALSDIVLPGSLVFVRPAAALDSFAQAPPVEPPLA